MLAKSICELGRSLQITAQFASLENSHRIRPRDERTSENLFEAGPY